jgi:N-methylhydantoinase B
MTTETRFDPVLMAVIAKRMDTITREMSNTLLRTGRSSVLNTARDFSCTVLRADGALINAVDGLPIHVVGARLLGESLNRWHPEVAAGEAYLHNDSYDGNTHAADFNVLVPVVHEGQHLFTVVAKAHQADCGNSQPTTYAAYARDAYEEGAVIFPCVLVQRDNEDVADVIRMCERRIRAPAQWYGDYLATLGAARIGERRLLELIEEIGAEDLTAFCEAWLDYSERRMVAAIGQLPAGTVLGEGAHDPVPEIGAEIPLQAKVTVRPDEGYVDVDLRENIDAIPAGYNLSEACSLGTALIGVLNQIPSDVPRNDGAFRRIRVLLRENCIAGIPKHPTSVSVSTTNVADRMVNLVQMAFADLGEGHGHAEGGLGIGASYAVIFGLDARHGDRPYVNQLIMGSTGGPASPKTDGWIGWGIPVDGGVIYRDSVEIVERKYPLLIHEVRLRQDGEGAGRRRGGPGATVSYGPRHHPVSAAFLLDGAANPPRGVRGGGPSAANETYLIDAAGEHVEVPSAGQVEIKPGERIVHNACGGGGYGPPTEREPQRVLADVRAGIVSIARARDIYGVALTDDDIPTIDEEATRVLRAVTA